MVKITKRGANKSRSIKYIWFLAGVALTLCGYAGILTMLKPKV